VGPAALGEGACATGGVPDEFIARYSMRAARLVEDSAAGVADNLDVC